MHSYRVLTPSYNINMSVLYVKGLVLLALLATAMASKIQENSLLADLIETEAESIDDSDIGGQNEDDELMALSEEVSQLDDEVCVV